MARLSRWDRWQALDDALNSVDAAIEVMRESEEDDDISDQLDDVMLAIHNRRDKVYSDIEAHDNAERDRERRDAYVGVI